MAAIDAEGAPGSRTVPDHRRERLRQNVIDSGFARIEDLAQEFGVSIMTVHRDLDALQRDGWLTKIRGGATANPSALIEAGVRERRRALASEKSAIAATAARLCAPGQSIYLDDSTTVLAMVPHLRDRVPLVAATNFVPLAQELSSLPGTEVTLLGGQYHATQEACFGLQTIDAVSQLHADIAFVSTTAVTGKGCYHRSEMTVMVKRAFRRHATRSVLMVDHAKFGRPAPHLLCQVSDFDVVITDDAIDPEDLAELRQQDVEILVAEKKP